MRFCIVYFKELQYLNVLFLVLDLLEIENLNSTPQEMSPP